MTFVFILTGLALFGVVHSWMAGQNVKQWVQQRLGARRYEASYRLFYNAFATLTLAPIGLIIVLSPGATLWQISMPWVALACHLIRLLGLAGLVVALLQIDLGRFVGTAQLQAYWRGEPLPLPEEPLQTGGLYSLVRHPLYLFSLLVLWPAPSMSEALFAFNIGATVYFLAGSRLEERRLLRAFGEDYQRYRDHVSWMLPSLRRFTHRTLRNNR